MKGLIHIYCGDGKGKTTAAFGLALRFSAVGKAVIAQFQKTAPTGEAKAAEGLSNITLLRLESSLHGFSWEFSEAEKAARKSEHDALFARAIAEVKRQGACLLVLDEMISALNGGLVSEDDVYAFLRQKPEELEVVLTGRDPAGELLALGDYVTEMRCVRHPYEKNIPARRGIEF